jgi:uncharacterized protein YpmS
MNNRWKIAFYSLLVAIILIPIIVLQILFPESNFHLGKTDQYDKEGTPVFEIQTEKEQLNFLINDQLNKLKKGRSDIDYFVEFNDEVSVKGFLTFFQRKIQFEMMFEPKVQENGDLLFQEKMIKLGVINLPGDKILEFIEGSTDLPKWVTINSDKESILFKLTEIKFKKDMYVKAEEFDLRNNDLRFKVYYEK